MRRRFLGAKSLPLLTRPDALLTASGSSATRRLSGYASGRTVYKYSSGPIVPHLLDAAPSAKFLSSRDPQTTQGPVDIVYTVPQGAQYLTIGIWDRFGKYVRKLVDQRAPRPGTHTQIWNLADDSGQIVSRGPFIYRITTDDDAESRIIVVNP